MNNVSTPYSALYNSFNLSSNVLKLLLAISAVHSLTPLFKSYTPVSFPNVADDEFAMSDVLVVFGL